MRKHSFIYTIIEEYVEVDAATKKEMVEMQGMFKQRNKAIEQSVKNHDPKAEYAIEKYLKENNES